MAPRRRPRKVGLRRMDAAVDALKPMGFAPDFIRRKVYNLLQLYGGDQGWPFIEDSSYKVLFDSILEEEEEKGVQCEQGEPSCRDSPNHSRPECDKEAEPSEPGALDEAAEHSCSNQDTVLAIPITDAPLSISVPVPECIFSPAENVITMSNEVNRANDILRNHETIAVLSDVCMLSGPPGFEHLPPLQLGCVPWKRKPCFGWLGPKDDDNFVLLDPAPVQGWKTGGRQRKRKSGWDVRPDDVV